VGQIGPYEATRRRLAKGAALTTASGQYARSGGGGRSPAAVPSRDRTAGSVRPEHTPAAQRAQVLLTRAWVASCVQIRIRTSSRIENRRTCCNPGYTAHETRLPGTAHSTEREGPTGHRTVHTPAPLATAADLAIRASRRCMTPRKYLVRARALLPLECKATPAGQDCSGEPSCAARLRGSVGGCAPHPPPLFFATSGAWIQCHSARRAVPNEGGSAKQSGLFPLGNSRYEWRVPEQAAKQTPSASAAFGAFGCRCWGFPCARPRHVPP
jgi:hypothetical protein